MQHYLYKLNFTTPLHCGIDEGRGLADSRFTVHSDTIFSALCIQALHKGGENLLERLVYTFKNDKALLSDALPYRNENLFLPKPIVLRDIEHTDADPKSRKIFKKLAYIPVSMLYEFLSESKVFYENKIEVLKLMEDYCFEDRRQCVSINEGVDPEPYIVGSVIFNDGCGLYIIMSCEEEETKELFEILLRQLGLSGLGGRISTGYGKFEADDPILLNENLTAEYKELYHLLNNKNADTLITINTSMPANEEMEKAISGAAYTLCRRGGFFQPSITGNTYKTLQKRRTVFAFSPGSSFKNKFFGDVYNLSFGGGHPVYRYLKPMFLGVNT
ncbi:MAG TPA: type III-A CRISPR-associated RAMP protein Csm4 [Ruminiclostridium sp.]|nr:type III-A CRISPR-associated RAMP protein Csm4 [Ruminiclostridium sp.]